MKKFEKIILIIGIALVALGSIGSASVLAANGFDLHRVYDIIEVNKTIELEEFDQINIDVIDSNINIVQGDKNSLEIKETNKEFHEISIDNGVLNIKNKHELFRIGFMYPMISGGLELTLNLSDEALKKVSIKTVSGNIKIQRLISDEDVAIKTTSGSLNINNLTGKNISIESISGAFNLTNLVADSLKLETTSGSIKMASSVVNNDITIDSVSGALRLDLVRARNYNLSTISGSVYLRLVEPRGYRLESVLGRIIKPELQNNENGMVYAKTISGSIEIAL